MPPAPAVQAAYAALQSGQLDPVMPGLERWLRQHADDLDAHLVMALCLRTQKQHERALYHLQRVQQGRPSDAQVPVLIANAHRSLKRLGPAAAALDQAERLAPGLPAVALGRSMLALAMDDAEAAVQHARRAWQADPSSLEAARVLLSALQQACRIEELVDLALACEQRWPGVMHFKAVLMWATHYSPRFSREETFERLRGYASYVHRVYPPDATPHANSRDPDRPLRVGYVSQDFRNRSAGHFIEPLIAQHDRERYPVFCYAANEEVDELTRRLQAHVGAGWRPIHKLSDRAVADLIRADRIDVLVDLTGHTGQNRLAPQSHKPAPVQMTYMGFPNTTGLPAIDYRVIDALTDPPGAEAFASEKLIRLPGCFLCYAPPPHAPPVSPRAAGPIRFGCFNTLAKLTAPSLDLFARVVRETPDSRLLLKAQALKDRGVADRFRTLLAERGVSPDRVDLRGETAGKDQHLATYAEVDIALDPFPYHGTTTTLEALWMGVPVVTLEGDRHLSRVGVSLLTNLGLSELVAKTTDDYAAIAAGLAADQPRRSAWRTGPDALRDRLGKSSICDAPAFTRRMESAYREAWSTWCRS